MGTQLKLPAQWAWIESRRDPIERLDALRHDVSETKARIREALDELAERHGIRASDVAYAMEGYTDDLLSDAVYNVERELEREIEAQDLV
jgi:cell division ATPase FtsA